MKRTILSLSLFFAGFLLLLSAPALSGYFPGFSALAQVGDGVCKNVGPNIGDCIDCFDQGGAWTAIGCVGEDGNPAIFIQHLLQLGVALGGGIAFLLILLSGFQTITSGANPEKLHAAKELMTSAISGLLLIIFSVFLLRLIGVDILQIPGFT